MRERGFTQWPVQVRVEVFVYRIRACFVSVCVSKCLQQRVLGLHLVEGLKNWTRWNRSLDPEEETVLK